MNSFSDQSSKEVINLSDLVNRSPQKYKNIYLKKKKRLALNIIKNRIINKLSNFLFDINIFTISSFVENSNLNTKEYQSDLILIAFEDIIKTNKFNCCDFYGKEQKNSKGFHFACRKYGIKFTFYGKRNHSDLSIISDLKSIIHLLIRTLAWIVRYLYSRRVFTNKHKNTSPEKNSELLFISYLDQAKQESLERGYLMSDYWGDLPRSLEKSNMKSDWLFIFDSDSYLKTPKKANNFINNLNKLKKNSQHECIDSYISISLVF